MKTSRSLLLPLGALVVSVKVLGGSLNSLVMRLGLGDYYGTIAALVVSGTCMCAFIGLYFFPSEDASVPAVQAVRTRVSIWLQVGAVVLIAYAAVVRCVAVGKTPIDYRQADMLPNVIAGFENLAEGKSPYRAHKLAPEVTIPHYYPPVLWVGYLPFYWSGVDIRYLNILAQLAVVLLFLHLVFLRRGGAVPSVSVQFISVAMVGVLLFSKLSLGQVLHVHTAALGGLLAVMCYCLIQQKYRAIRFVIPLLLLSRETALLLVLPYWGFLLLESRRELIKCLATTAVVVVPVVMIFVWWPDSDFFAGPRFYAGLLKSMTLENKSYAAYPGLAWVLVLWKLTHWQVVFQSLGLFAAAGLGLVLRPRSATQVIALMGISYLPFILFAAVTFHYLYIELLILLLFSAGANVGVRPRVLSC